MTNTATAAHPTRTAAGQWTLTGIANDTGRCDCCARAITQRVFQVTHPQHGDAFLGRRCAAKATGYATNAIERELARIAHCAELNRRRVIVTAAYPVLAAEYQAAQAAAGAARKAGLDPSHAYYTALTTGADVFGNAVTTDCWWGGRGWAAYATWAEYIEDHISR